MRRLLAVVAVALMLPAAAHAKEIDALAVCGPEACEDADVAGFGHEDPVAGAVGSGEAPPPSAFLRLDFAVDGDAAAFSVFYEPRSGLVATQGPTGQLEWAPLVPRLATAVKEAARRVEPFPAPRITGVRIGARRVTGDPSTYLSLLTVTGPSLAPKTASSGLAVVFETAPNPWTQTRLLYYPEDDVLQRGTTLVQLPASLAADLEAGRSLGTGGGSPAVPWLPIAVALAGAALLLGLFLRTRAVRRRALVVAGVFALALPAGAAAKVPLALVLDNATPVVGQAVKATVGMETGAAFDGTLRLVAVPPGTGLYAALGDERRYRVGLARGGENWWTAEVSFAGPGPWLLVVPNWGAPGYAIPPPIVRRVWVSSAASSTQDAAPLGGGRTVPWLPIATLLAGAAGLLLLRTLGTWSASWRRSSSSTSSGRPRWRPGRTRRSSAAA